MSAQSSLLYTCHSFRHFDPTLRRQLNISSEGISEMGHWSLNSAMPLKYDSAACVHELLNKNVVTQAFCSGWDPVELGCIPHAVPRPPPQRNSGFHPHLCQAIPPFSRVACKFSTCSVGQSTSGSRETTHFAIGGGAASHRHQSRWHSSEYL